MQYIDIILLALLAAFVLYRLSRVLGRRPDDSGSGVVRPRPRRDENVVALPGRTTARPVATPRAAAAKATADGDVLANAGVAEVRLNDPTFDASRFLEGARAAYEMVVTAFAKGDRDTLRRLLTREVFENFSRAIAEREERGETLETTVVGIRTTELVEARMAGRNAEVTVRFVSDLINAVKDRAGTPKEETAGSGMKEVTDTWTFVRDTRSRDPNWALAATHSPAE